MKLSAIARRGAKKDFIDLYCLLERYSLAELLAQFEQTFPQVDTFHVVKSLTYFDDADLEIDPEMLIKVNWEQAKKTITRKVEAFLRRR